MKAKCQTSPIMQISLPHHKISGRTTHSAIQCPQESPYLYCLAYVIVHSFEYFI